MGVSGIADAFRFTARGNLPVKRIVSRVVLCLVAVSSLVACGVKPQPFDRAQKSRIRTIGLVQIDSPKEYDYHDYNPALGQGGLIGASVNAVSNNIRQEKLTAALAAEGFDYGPELTEALEARLRDAGYEVVRVPVTRKRPIKWLKTYEGLPEADAYLDVATNGVGYRKHYFSRGLDSEHHPLVDVKARLADRAGEPLYIGVVTYGLEKQKRRTTLKPDAKHLSTESYDDLLKDTALVAEGVRAAVDAVARQISDDLR